MQLTQVHTTSTVTGEAHGERLICQGQQVNTNGAMQGNNTAVYTNKINKIKYCVIVHTITENEKMRVI